MVTSVSKHQDGGMYKTPAYPGYPFLMLPDPYLPNGSVSPSVSTLILAAAVCLLAVAPVRSRRALLLSYISSKHGLSGSVPQEEVNKTREDRFLTRFCCLTLSCFCTSNQ